MAYNIPILYKESDQITSTTCLLYIKTELFECNTKTILQLEDFMTLGGSGVFNWNKCTSVLSTMGISSNRSHVYTSPKAVTIHLT